MPIVSVELTIFVFIFLPWVSLDFAQSFHKFLVLDPHEYLGNKSIKRWQYQVEVAR